MAGAIRTTRLLGPVQLGAGTTVLATPATGTRWKTDRVYLFNHGFLESSVSLELGASVAARIVFRTYPGVGNLETLVFEDEFTVMPSDSFAIAVAALDVITFTLNGFVLQD